MTITTEEVEKLLNKKNPGKSPGPGQIHPRVLKECAKQLAMPLTIAFKKYMEEGNVPTDWKEAKVTPIYKKAGKKSASKYRPVSLTSVACKAMERLIRDRIMKHMDTNQLVVDNQYGFRSKRSTALQLLKVLDQ